MNIQPITTGPIDRDVFARIAVALREQGYIVLDAVFSVEQLQHMFIDIKQTDNSEFHHAGIGRDQSHMLNQFVRRDRICWLQADHAPVSYYMEWTEQLREYLNRELFLGLFDYECHYAHYQPGGFYKKHYDTFQGSSTRRLSTALYLNPDWKTEDGGELVLYADDNETVLETVLPRFGNMVIFLSEEFPHEVLPCSRSRYSLTGWFRINNSTGQVLDPPV